MVSCCLVCLRGSLLDNEPVDVLEFGSLRRQNRSYVLQINGQHAGHRFRKRLYHSRSEKLLCIRLEPYCYEHPEG